MCSDLHIGYLDDNKDGEYWLGQAMQDIRANCDVDYAMVLGDIAHGGSPDEFTTYLSFRDSSPISEWYELAGNHDHRNGGIESYRALICNELSYAVIDGNIVWIVLSDEQDSTEGEIGESTYNWLIGMISRYREDKNIVVSSHQLVYDTVANLYGPDNRYLYRKGVIAEDLSSLPVDLWLCGHEHHHPWGNTSVYYNGRTTFLNVASLSHAYRTGESQSFILELDNDASMIKAVRRIHDTKKSDIAGISIPLSFPIRLGRVREKLALQT